MKLPNGYGSVTKLSGNRRKPYLARVTVGWDTDIDAGKCQQKRFNLGTFRTKKEALQALAEYGTNPYDIHNQLITVEELYDRWSSSYFQDLESDSSVRTITSAWKYCHQIYGMRVKDLRARHIKGVMESGYIIQDRGKDVGQKIMASPGTKSRIKSLFNLMLDYALEYELVDRNYARTFDLSNDIIKEKQEAARSHINFNDDEMLVLWNNVNNVRFVDWIIIQCYMGWRPQELVTLKLDDVDLDRLCITGGMKTESGKRRVVPIHSRIVDLVRQNYNFALKLGSDNLFNDPDSVKGSKTVTYDKYAGRFFKAISGLNIREGHRPHDPRTTFITMAKKSGVDEYVIKRLVGHKISDITENIYTKRDLEWVRCELEKIP